MRITWFYAVHPVRAPRLMNMKLANLSRNVLDHNAKRELNYDSTGD